MNPWFLQYERLFPEFLSRAITCYVFSEASLRKMRPSAIFANQITGSINPPSRGNFSCPLFISPSRGAEGCVTFNDIPLQRGTFSWPPTKGEFVPNPPKGEFVPNPPKGDFLLPRFLRGTFS